MERIEGVDVIQTSAANELETEAIEAAIHPGTGA
jgi:hypothetical protein